MTGDSAGGNLTIQVLLHIIHPLAGLPKLLESSTEESKFAGAYLMSPWTTLLPREDNSKNSYKENAMWDIVSSRQLRHSGSVILSEIKSNDHLAYVDSHFAPSDWYDGVGDIVKKMLITVGRYECLREDIIKFGKHLESTETLDVKLVVDKYGVHDDPFLDFVAREKKLGELTPMIVSWCREAFSESMSR